MSISTIRRQMKNVACNYSDAQVKVREATSNDPWGPSTVMMSEIADLTYNPAAFNDIMMMLFKRLNDHGKNWRHVYKSLILLDYIIKCGSERIAQQCRENIYTIETLKDFQHVEDNRDQGLNVREKAKQMVILLKDEEKLKTERQKFQATRRRFVQSDSVRNGNESNVNGRISELEDARPSSLSEEEMQLQIALALSKEEMKKEEDIRKGYHARLQHALEESKKDNSDSLSNFVDKPDNINDINKIEQNKPTTNVIDDLLSLEFGTPSLGESHTATTIQPITNDPWAPLENNSTNLNPWNLPTYEQSTALPSTVDPMSFNVSNINMPNETVNNKVTENNTMFSMFEKNEQDKNVIKAENFLGPNSNLVNLDNLMGCSSTPAITKTSANPFLPISQQPTNPFIVQQGTPLTLNELIQVQQRSQEKPTTINLQNTTNTFPLF
ncbi:Liquid facets [Strongyloides ratti]|uniref:Liquid facets n=1 Tax=Strongyloides ratti TaxID=34506 RepID=A0A090KRD9_STRRB|nr:Liquid facets [Strongyloides ratti]CEF60074.1 Liquid facets [Strongyloides ratti]